MDEIDRKIIISLIRNGRVPLKRVAEEAGISPQALNYRISRLKDAGVIKKYSIRVNPAVYGMVSGFAAFRNDEYDSEDIISRFNCLEEITIYEFKGRSRGDLENSISRAEERIGQPVMKYIPQPRDTGVRINDDDLRMISILREEPRILSADLARRAGLPAAKVRKRLELLERKRVVSVIAEVDFTKIDSVLYSIISAKVESIIPAISGGPLFVISDSGNGIVVCYSDSLKGAKASIKRVRDIDPDAEVMVVYDYEFREQSF